MASEVSKITQAKIGLKASLHKDKKTKCLIMMIIPLQLKVILRLSSLTFEPHHEVVASMNKEGQCHLPVLLQGIQHGPAPHSYL